MVAAVLIAFDLHRMRQKRQQGQDSAWYERPMLWFAACGFPFGLALASSMLIGRLAYRIDWYLVLGCIVLFFLPFAGGLITVLRNESKQVALAEEVHLKHLAATSPIPVAISRKIEDQAIVTMVSYTIIIGILALFKLVSFFTHQIWFSLGACTLLFFAMMVGWIIRSRVISRWFKRLNHRRVALALENRRIGIVEPVSLEPVQPLMPPLVLRLKRRIINYYLVLTVALVLVWSYPINAANSGLNVFYSFFYVFLLLFSLRRGLCERVEASTQELVVVRGAWPGRWQQRMPWQEARLFVCYKVPSFFGGKTTMTYELSSPGRVVQWTRAINSRSLFAPWRTELPTDEYERQTQALCACITVQTGLQLHDLSEETSNVRQQEIMMMQTHK
jgi:hypothetical protein